MTEQFDAEAWVEVNFGNVDFNDSRLDERCMNIAQAMFIHPKEFISGLYDKSSATIAAYRFLHNDKTSFESVTKAHRQMVYNQIVHMGEEAKRTGSSKPVVLLLGDGSEINFGYKRKIKNAGPIGEKNQGKGFIFHPNLAVDYSTHQLLGMLSGLVEDRKPATKGKNGKRLTITERMKLKDKESKQWLKSLDGLQPLTQEVELVCVNDRGADIYEYINQLNQDGYSYVIRASQKERVIAEVTDSSKTHHLHEYIISQTIQGEDAIEVVEQKVDNKKQPYRKSVMQIRYGSYLMLPPKHTPDSDIKYKPFIVNFVHLIEDPSRAFDKDGKPCEVVQPLEWIIQTNRPVTNITQAREIRDMYKNRWLIEEYFCALKSGCGLEDSQLQDAYSLKTLCGFYSICAIFIVSLKLLENYQPETDVYKIIPKEFVTILQKKLGPKFPIKTAHDLYIGIAKQGGFLNRTSDPDPGWKRLWRGFKKLLTMYEGYCLAIENTQ